MGVKKTTMARYKNNKITSVTATCVNNCDTTNAKLVPFKKSTFHSDYLSSGDASSQHFTRSQKSSSKIPTVQHSTDYSSAAQTSNAYAAYYSKSPKPITLNTMTADHKYLQNNSPKLKNNTRFSLSKNAAENIFIKNKTKNTADNNNWAKVLPPYRVQHEDPIEDVDEVEEIHDTPEIPSNLEERQSTSQRIRRESQHFKNFGDKVKVASNVVKNMRDEHENISENFPDENDDGYVRNSNLRRSTNSNLTSRINSIYKNRKNPNKNLDFSFDFSQYVQKGKNLTLNLRLPYVHWPSVFMTLLCLLIILLLCYFFIVKRHTLSGSCMEIFQLGKTSCTCSSCS